MRHVLHGLAAGIVLCHAAVAQAQQGSLQITGAAQGLTGNPQRIAGQNQVDPDFGVSWLQPGSRFGTFQIELRGTRRTDRLHFGRTYVALREVRFARLSWSFEGGDTYFTRAIGEYRFTNLTVPAVTFNGAAISGRSNRGSVQLLAGHATAWRNIFGTDPDTMAQTLIVARSEFKIDNRLEVLGRVSRIRTDGLKEFSFTISDSRQAGAGMRYAVTPSVQLIGDVGLVQYRRVGSDVFDRDASVLAGANFLLSRGWVQVNASRFSPGEFPAMNDPLHDRETLFAAGEYDVWKRVRLFAGWEGLRTNLSPVLTADPSRDLPRNLTSRGFGGGRVQIGERSIVTVRTENGGTIVRPIRGGLDAESDSGNWSAEWHSTFGSVSSYTRFSWRQNVSRLNVDASYDQHDVSTQLFLRLSPSAQIFGIGTITRHESGASNGSSYWQAGGGAQFQVPRRTLWIRGEASTSRNVDLITREFVPQESYNFGVNGQLSRGISVAFNISADRTPVLLGTGTPWTTRSMVRITQTFSTGSARVPLGVSPTVAAATRSRGTGTVVGNVYLDWNGNGTQDPGEGPLENIPVRIASLSSVTTRRDGEFAFLNVPAGSVKVGLDTSAIPVDFDPPSLSSLDIELDRNVTRRVSFGLIPLGSVRGRVVRDANGNGRVDPGEEPLEGVVLVLDGGARSEQVRKGEYRFDAIRSGDHVVVLLRESLPEGATMTSPTEVPIVLKRDQLTVDLDFAVVVEKRPETRRVFPSRIGAAPATPSKPTAQNAPASRPPAVTRPTITRPPAAPPTPPPTPRPTPRPAEPRSGFDIARVPPLPPPPGAAGTAARYAIQIAALNDPIRARALARQLSAAGYRAYLVEPGPDDPDGPYRIRVGGYSTRAAAAAAAKELERLRNERLWVIREGTSAAR